MLLALAYVCRAIFVCNQEGVCQFLQHRLIKDDPKTLIFSILCRCLNKCYEMLNNLIQANQGVKANGTISLQIALPSGLE